jgi:hypothetical protein
MNQRMVWLIQLFSQKFVYSIPDGYRIRLYRKGDDESFFEIIALSEGSDGIWILFYLGL